MTYRRPRTFHGFFTISLLVGHIFLRRAYVSCVCKALLLVSTVNYFAYGSQAIYD